ncbi:hypothetical protein [Anaerolinea sp.]|uniref:hypothetical protein n=1 Tax=Anaerolinea sp. TaxID=1872519 RepID=UPI002ACD9D8B|nr:hypothetical protein [Anaerolinea sp.]
MNIIVTCGTSQTEKFGNPKLLQLLNLNLSASGYTSLESYFGQDPDPIRNGRFEREFREVANNVAEIIKEFIEKSQSIEYIGKKNNPLGAEISTLLVYFKQNQNQNNHTFYILRSDTYSGWFNAEVLGLVLQNLGWASQVELVPIENLREQPTATGTDPLINLGRELKEILTRITESQTKEPPLMVISGGFKSILPCLTVYSMIFAVKMVYLFEQSSHLVEINTISEIRDEKRLRKLWKDMADLKIAASVDWFKDALSLRTSENISLPWL